MSEIRAAVVPTEELVRAACEEFDRYYGEVEQSLTELFGQYPNNRDLHHVLLKVVALNSLYSTQIPVYSETIPNLLDVAHHIQGHAEGVDSAFAVGSPEIVDEISRVVVPEKKQRNYFSFATKYCSFHRPDAYAIWDSRVELYLAWLQKQSDFAAGFDVHGLWKYPTFHRVMITFRERYGLGVFSLKEIDKFLWVYGEAVANRSS